MTTYKVDTGLMDAIMGRPYVFADSLDKARKMAIAQARKKVGYYGVGVYNTSTGKKVGEVERPYFGDTEFIWKTIVKNKEVIYDLYSSGRLGKRWGRRPGY